MSDTSTKGNNNKRSLLFNPKIFDNFRAPPSERFTKLVLKTFTLLGISYEIPNSK